MLSMVTVPERGLKCQNSSQPHAVFGGSPSRFQTGAGHNTGGSRDMPTLILLNIYPAVCLVKDVRYSIDIDKLKQ
jgi:hypothetical protein